MKCTNKKKDFFSYSDQARSKKMKITYPSWAIDFILVHVSVGCGDGLDVVWFYPGGTIR